MIKTYTTSELVSQIFENLRILAPEGAEYSYIAGYMSSCLASVAEGGVDELVSIVDWTNQRVEAKRKGVV